MPDPRLGFIQSLLLDADYRQYEIPVVIDGIDFTFDAAFTERTSRTLVIVQRVDETSVESTGTALWALERVANALDHAGSMIGISIVFLSKGPVPAKALNAASRFARVLYVSEGSPEEIARQLLPLVPLRIGIRRRDAEDVLERLYQSAASPDAFRLAQAALGGTERVKEELSALLDESFAEVQRLL